jgi:hypothetical protein
MRGKIQEMTALITETNAGRLARCNTIEQFGHRELPQHSSSALAPVGHSPQLRTFTTFVCK